MNAVREHIRKIHTGDVRAVARAISMVEEHHRDLGRILSGLDPERIRNSSFIGVTGSPGVGKSTLTNQLIRYFRRKNKNVGVISIDPSSPLTGGAVLGDRIRMMEHANDRRVIIRSMASRGRLGGLSTSVGAAARIMASSGCDPVIVETLGVGQSEIDVALLTDVTLLVFAPGYGDDIQFLKSGLSEIADIWVINKMDLPGSHAVASYALSEAKVRNRPVFKTIASEEKGVDELAECIESVENDRRRKKELGQKRVRSIQYETTDWVMEKLHQEVQDLVCKSTSHKDPYLLSDEIIKKLGLKSRKKRA